MDRQEENSHTAKMKLFNFAVLGLAGAGLLCNVCLRPSIDSEGHPAEALAGPTKTAIFPTPTRMPENPNSKKDVPPESFSHSDHPAVAAKPEIRIRPAVAERGVRSIEAGPVERPSFTEKELQRQLSQSVATIGFEDEKKLSELITRLRNNVPDSAANNQRNRPEDEVLAVLDEAEAGALPFQENQDCKLPGDEAEWLERYAGLMHQQIDRIDRSLRHRFPTTADERRDPALAFAIKNLRKWRTDKAVPAMMQILQVEPDAIRGQLVETASNFQNAAATDVLVNRAVFDLSPKVRKHAHEALKRRTPSSYREDLFAALRYPWPEAAWNAAETLIAVNDQDAVPDLIELLDAPDPTQPYRDETGRVVQQELVRLNHVKNCLLCHARTAKRDDPVTGFVPLPRTRAYYQSSESGVLVRADVTYLRQDFSLTYNAGLGPGSAGVRFDYLVRTRELTSQEIAAMDTKPGESTGKYPQREAVLFALQKLTGHNRGRESAAWRRMFVKQIAAK